MERYHYSSEEDDDDYEEEEDDNDGRYKRSLSSANIKKNHRSSRSIRVYDCRDEKSLREVKEIFVRKGKAELELEIPENIQKINIEVKYLDTVASIWGIEKVVSESKEYIQAKLLTDNPSLREPVEIEVLSTKPLEKLSYQIIGSGNVLNHETLTMAPTKNYTLSFEPSHDMAPKSQVIIYYLAHNGEIISHKIDVEFESELRNQIDIQLSKGQAKPGEELEISVKTQPNSFVGLLGVDQSVLVLKRGNDIEKSHVLDELEKYNEEISTNDVNYVDFNNALIITNAKSEYKAEKKLPVRRPMYPFPNYAMANGSMRNGLNFRVELDNNADDDDDDENYEEADDEEEEADDEDNEDESNENDEDVVVKTNVQKPLQQQPIKIRKVFPETWIFDGFETAHNESSARVITKMIPDTITSWIITGFSLNPIYGLGLTKEASKLNVFQPFFVSTNLPYSVKRGEIVAIPIVVFNYMESDQAVDVTFFNSNQEFEFVEVDESKNVDLQRKKSVFVKSNEGASVKFLIKPLKIGHITIKITAQSNIAGDGVEQQLLVIPEGVTQFMNEAILVDLKDGEFETSIDIEISSNVVENSTRIEAAVTGDLLGHQLRI